MYKAPLIIIVFLIVVSEKLSAQYNATVSFTAFSKNNLGVENFPEKINLLISPNYAAANFGFMCKKELNLEKRTAIPFRFRVGSLENCNWLEGKQRYQPLQP
jgi:hypothetical protein